MTTPFDDPQAELAWMFLQGLSEGADLDDCFELLRDDFSYWTIRTRTSVDKRELRRQIERRRRDLRINLDLIQCINDGENVVIEAQCDYHTAAGVRYESPVVFIVETRHGQIVSVREYIDTRFAEDVVG